MIAAQGSGARSRPFPVVFAALLAGVLLASLDQSLISTELPTIAGELRGLQNQAWATSGYLAAATVGLPTAGKVGDVLGRRSVLIAAVSLFVLASIGCASAHTFAVFVICRAGQGLGAGGVLVLAQALTAAHAPITHRGRYLGLLGGVFGVSTIAGPLLGGWFIDHSTWRWSYGINVPIGIAVLAVVRFMLPADARDGRARRLDVAGVLLLVPAIGGLVAAADAGGSGAGWFAPATIGAAVVSLIAWLTFAVVERHADDPVVPVVLLRRRAFAASTAIGGAVGIGMFAVIGLLPTWLQFGRGISATGSGLLLVPIMGGLVLGAVVSGAAIDRTRRPRGWIAVGALLAVIALVLLTGLIATAPLWAVEANFALLGLGIGMIVQNVVGIAQSSARGEDLGAVTGATTTIRETGGALGASLFGSAYAQHAYQGIERAVRDAGVAPANVHAVASMVRPQDLARLPGHLAAQIATAYTNALPPVVWLLVPVGLLGLALVPALPPRMPSVEGTTADRPDALRASPPVRSS